MTTSMDTSTQVADQQVPVQAQVPQNLSQTKAGDSISIAAKASLLIYGVFAYLVGCAGLVAFILAMAGVIPLGQLVVISHNNLLAVVFNLALISLFGVQHSVMARPFFKRWMTQFFTSASERSTFVLASGVTLLFIIAFWQPVSGSLWNLEGTGASYFIWGLFLFGWSYLFAATFSINHWDLFGLRQMWFAVQEKAYTAPKFTENWMYRYSRHPIMLGVLIGIWSLPEMSNTKLVMSLTLTAYTFIGVAFEERDLIRQFGQRYLDYKNQVGMLFTLKRSS